MQDRLSGNRSRLTPVTVCKQRQQKQAYTCDRVQTAATEAGLHLWPCANSNDRSRLTPVTVCKQRQQKQDYTCDRVQTAATEAGLHLWPCANSGNRSRLTPVTVCKQRRRVWTHSSHGIIFQMPGLAVVFSGTTQGSNSHPHGTDWLCKWKRSCQISFPPRNTTAFLHGTVGVTSLPHQGPRARHAKIKLKADIP